MEWRYGPLWVYAIYRDGMVYACTPDTPEGPLRDGRTLRALQRYFPAAERAGAGHAYVRLGSYYALSEFVAALVRAQASGSPTLRRLRLHPDSHQRLAGCRMWRDGPRLAGPVRE